MTMLYQHQKRAALAFRVIIATCAVLLLGISIIQAQEPSAPGSADFDPFVSYSRPNAIRSQAQKSGKIRVIVGLSQPTGTQSVSLGNAQAMNAQTLSSIAANVSSAQHTLLSSLNGQQIDSVRQFKYIPFVTMTVDAAALDALYASPLVASISTDVLYRATHDTSSALVGAQGTDGAHAMGITGKGFAVAVLDTGVDKAHPALKGRIVSEACFSTNNHYNDTYSLCPGGLPSAVGQGSGQDCPPSIWGCGHGTHVAGIVASSNRVYTGVAPRANIVSIKVFSEARAYWCPQDASCVVAYASDVIAGLEHVLDLQMNGGVQIAAVNVSFGGRTYTTRSACDTANASMKYAIDALRNAGIATIVAAGNDSKLDALSTPACISSAISVGAVSHNDEIASWSNTAYFLDLLAPGIDITSAKNRTKSYINYSGTSMAAPHIAGAWALLREAKPQASVPEIHDALQMSGKLVADTRNADTTRYKSRIQVDKAVEWLLGRRVYQPTQPQNLLVSDYSETTLQLDWDDVHGEAGYRIERTPYGAEMWEVVGSTGIDKSRFTDVDLNCETFYEYRVVAYNLSGESSGSFPSYGVTTACTGKELLGNRHFEVNLDEAKSLPDTWQTSGKMVGDQVVKDGVNDMSFSGPNAFMFSGGSTVNGTLIQNLNLYNHTFNPGDSLTLSAYINRRSAVAGSLFGSLVVVFSDNKTRKVGLKIPSGMGYRKVTSIPLNLNRTDIKKIAVQFFYKKATGKYTIDDVSLWQTYGETSLANQKMVMTRQDVAVQVPVPAAPTDLRGN